MSEKDPLNHDEPLSSGPAPETSSEYDTVRERVENAGATEQLASMLADESARAGELVEKEEKIELLAEDKNAPISWEVVVPAFILVIAVVLWGLIFPENFSGTATGAFTWVVDKIGRAHV